MDTIHKLKRELLREKYLNLTKKGASHRRRHYQVVRRCRRSRRWCRDPRECPTEKKN
jgi:hypothetical protein